MNPTDKLPRKYILTFNIGGGIFALYCAILCNFGAFERFYSHDLAGAIGAWGGVAIEAAMSVLIFTGVWLNWFMKRFG